MKILMINVVCGIRSTGRICTDLATALVEQGHEVKIAYGRESVPEKDQKYAVQIGSDLDVKLHVLKSRLFDGMGFGSKFATIKFIEWVKEYDPDVIHLHNIHGYYINIRVLFEYLRNCGKKIIWTLHDCWSFTGHCAYFDYVGCDLWKSGCHKCIQKDEYPARLWFDKSATNYHIKKELFSGIKNLKIVTPSQWLADLVLQSFLKDYSVQVIHNGIDTSVFLPCSSNIKEKYGCVSKRIILGVAAVWDKRKGLDTFVSLSKHIDPNVFQIILVGVEKAQADLLPNSIICIERTNNAHELAELYSAADVFINPTLEDNYPTTNLEAIACGTPVITFDTGGSGESAQMYGKVVPKNDINGLIQAINNFNEIQPEKFKVDYKYTVQQYLELYTL